MSDISVISGNASTIRVDANYAGRSARDALDMWAWGASPVYRIAPIAPDATADDFRSSVWRTGPFAVTRLKFPAQTFDHGREQQGMTGGYVSLQMILSGRARGHSAGAPIDQRAGSIHAIDYDQPYRGVHDATELCGIFIPRELAGFNQRDVQSALRVHPASASGRVLQHEFVRLIRKLEADRFDFLPTLERIAAVLAVHVREGRVGEAQHALAASARRDALDGMIEARLADFTLTPEKVAHAFGISRATLYRLYDGEGGVRAYIGERRLCRAVSELAVARQTRGIVHRTAERWGFSSDAVFNRAVRRQFGVTPGSLTGSIHDPRSTQTPMIAQFLG